MRRSTEWKVGAGVAAALILLAINAFVSWRSTLALIESDRLVEHTYQVLSELDAVLATMTDAETGERGFVITREERFLEPYRAAVTRVNGHVETLRRLTADNPRQQKRIPVLREKVAAHLRELEQGIDTARTDPEGARKLVASGAGKRLMDDLRAYIATMEGEENNLLRNRAVRSSTTC